MEVVSRVNIDLARKGVNPIVYAVQNDENTRKIVVSLFCNGTKFDVAEDVFAVIGYSKPDGTKGIYDVLSNGYPAFKIAGNTVEITLAAQALTIPGKVVIVIALLDQNENQLGIFPIDVLVYEDPGANAIDSEDYINLTKTIGLIVEKELEKAKESGEFDGPQGPKGDKGEKGDSYTLTDEDMKTIADKVETYDDTALKNRVNALETKVNSLVDGNEVSY